MPHASSDKFLRRTLVLTTLVLGCGVSALRRPPYTAHDSADLVAIPYPPPPARIEVIPESSAPPADAVWVDGEWAWNGRRWSWRRGRWVIPPHGAAFAPWQTVRNSKGALYLAAGGWRGADGGPIEDPVSAGEAKGSRLPIVNLDGEEEATGADIRSERNVERDGGADASPRRRDRDGGE